MFWGPALSNGKADSAGSQSEQSGPSLDADQLFPQAYEQLHTLAEGYMRRERADHTLRPTALINEAYLRLGNEKAAPWNDRSHFMAIAAQAMRRVLVDHAKAHRRQKRSGGRNRVPLHETMVLARDHPVDLLALDEALTELAKLEPEHARIIELRFFGGLTGDETAAALGISPSGVDRGWRAARAWLFKKLGKGVASTDQVDNDE